MNPKKTLRSIEAGSLDVRFSDLCALAEAFGFRLARVSGSHHIYSHPRLRELLNLQQVHGRAKPYQVRQLMSLIARYSLKMEDRS